MKNTDEKLVQLNARVPEETKRIVRAAAALTGIKMEVLAADAIKLYCGIANSEEARRRKKVQKTLKSMKPSGSPFSSLREYEEAEIAGMAGMAQQFTLTV